MQKTFHVQPYPLWALWSHSSEVDYLGRVVGWVSVHGGQGSAPADEAVWSYPVVHLADTGSTESLDGDEYDLYERPELALERNAWTAEQVAAGVRRSDAA